MPDVDIRYFHSQQHLTQIYFLFESTLKYFAFPILIPSQIFDLFLAEDHFHPIYTFPTGPRILGSTTRNHRNLTYLSSFDSLPCQGIHIFSHINMPNSPAKKDPPPSQWASLQMVPHDSDQWLEKTFCLRTRFPLQPYPLSKVKSRPPFFTPGSTHLEISESDAKAAVEKYFPGLFLRSTYREGRLFEEDGYKHLLTLADLEGAIRRGDGLTRLEHLWAGMRHFGMYLQDMIFLQKMYLVVRSSDETEQPWWFSGNLGIKEGTNRLRLFFIPVLDEKYRTWHLMWYDQRSHKSYFVTWRKREAILTRQLKEALAVFLDEFLGIKVTKTIVYLFCSPPDQESVSSSGMLMIENFRMRVLESAELLGEKSEFKDWQEALYLTKDEGVEAGRESPWEAMKKVHCKAYAMELGCTDTIRWPATPMIIHTNWKEYRRVRRRANGDIYRHSWVPNSNFASQEQMDGAALVPSTPGQDQDRRDREHSSYLILSNSFLSTILPPLYK